MYGGDGGPATSASLASPQGLCLDTNGNLFVADYFNSRVRKISSSGIITTIAGNGVSTYGGDGGLATSASLISPIAIAVDDSGNVFIADYNNNRVRKVNTSGIITTYGGNGAPGYSGDGGPATLAKLFNPSALALDSLGDLLVADEGNACVRKINSAGIITTVAGNGTAGFSGDGGPAATAQIMPPTSIVVDKTGNYYIGESSHRIRKINAAGIISTFAGTGSPGFSGDGGLATSAQFKGIFGLASDRQGSIYVSDRDNHRIRKIDTSGVINTVVALGTPGFSGDGGNALFAELNQPMGIVMDSAYTLFIADNTNERVRKVTNATGVSNPTEGTWISIYPNPAVDVIKIHTSVKPMRVDIINAVGVVVAEFIPAQAIDANIENLKAGMYFVRLKTEEYVFIRKLVVN